MVLLPTFPPLLDDFSKTSSEASSIVAYFYTPYRTPQIARVVVYFAWGILQFPS